MSDTGLDLIVLGDIHYVGPDVPARTGSELRFRFGLELGVRAVRDALRSGRPDAVVLVGDIVDRGTAPGAMDDLRRVRDALAAFNLPVIAVPGNHDDHPGEVERIFGCCRGRHALKGYELVTFVDGYAPGSEVAERPAEQMAVLRELRDAGRPVIALQHPVIRPAIVRDFPYNLAGAEALARAFSEAGVCLSISGHFHAGLQPHTEGGTCYVVCPALSVPPFAYTRLRLVGRDLAACERVPLSLAGIPGLHDLHVHTNFAYCATDITPEGALERMELLGIPTVGLVEHVDQLYLPQEGFWQRTDGGRREALGRAREEGHARHQDFRQRMLPLRSERVLLGLEIEAADGEDGLAVLDGDAGHCDYLIGAVHHLGTWERPDLSQGETEELFLAAVRQMAESGVDILAHPFRYFPKRRKLRSPENLYRPVAELLAGHGVAAELNFHTYEPEPEFYALCLERGVKLAIGSDAHGLVEVGELRPHVEFLRRLGVFGRLDEVLWRKPGCPAGRPGAGGGSRPDRCGRVH